MLARRSLIATLCLAPGLAFGLPTPIEAQGAGVSPIRFDLQARRLGGMRAQVATLLVQGGIGGGIATEVLAVPVDSAGEKPGERLVPVLIEIEGPTLLSVRDVEADAEADHLRQRIEIYAYALSPQGSVVDFITQGLRLDLETLGEAIYAGGLKFVGSLSLPPGLYSLRVLVMDVASGQYGLRTVPLAVPDASINAPILLAPLVAEPSGSWLLVREDVTPETPLPALAEAGSGGEEPADRGEAPEAISPEQAVRPLVLGRDASLPSAFPLLDSGSTVEVHLLAFRLSGKPRVTAKLAPQEGGPPHQIPIEVVARLGTEDPLIERLTGRFTVPELSTGAFLLSFAAEAAGGASETAQIRALVLADNPLGRPLAWGQLRSAAAEIQRTADATTGPAPELDLPRRKKHRVSALQNATRERYERVLAGLATGASFEQTEEALVAMEQEIFQADPSEGLPALQQGEMALAEELAAADPEALVPLVSFHLDLYLRYRREREFALATHARHLTVQLAMFYAETANTEAARLIASQALTTLATEMLDAGLRDSGGAALEKALELDERNEAARLQVAAHYERLGSYARAADALRKLVEYNPKSAEGRLRLALNLRRTGDAREAENMLRRLISESNPDWTLTVAYTELANLYFEGRREREAVTLLRQAVDRLPNQDQLYIQLAYALDRQREFLEARRVLAQLTGRDQHLGNGGTPSPRHRYARGTEEGLAVARQRVTDAARTRQPLLAATLDRLGSRS